MNSTSTLSTVRALGTGKEFRPVEAYEKKTSRKDELQFYSEAGAESDIGHDGASGPSVTSASEEGAFTKTGPCKFYLIEDDSDNYKLGCVFCPESHRLSYSYVYRKEDSGKIKKEVLQETLGNFVNELDRKSPDSEVSAVRFSTYKALQENKLSHLVMLDWTNNPKESTAVLNLKRGDGSATAYETSKSDEGKTGIDQYNYVMTGGTNVQSGLEAFQTYLEDRAPNGPGSEAAEAGKEASRYLIVFTDGVDDSLTDKGGDKEDAKAAAKSLKAAGWKIYCVMLPSAGQPLDDAEDFLKAISSDNEFIAVTGDITMEKAFSDILDDIVFKLENYTVQDYIDPRFDLVARTEERGSEKLIRLNKDGKITIEGETQPLSAEGKDIWVKEGDGSGEKVKKAQLCWDGDAGTGDEKGMYYIRWTGQEIPGCAIGAASLEVWKSTITLRAKEDFIGGNAVLTNGQDKDMNYVYYPEDESKSSGTLDRYHKEKNKGASVEGWESDEHPSKGFPRVTVNVGLLPRDVEDTEVIYMGEKVKPMEIAKALMEELEHNDGEKNGSHYYWEYLERYASAHLGKYPKGLDSLLGELILGKDSGAGAKISGTGGETSTAPIATAQADEEVDMIISDETEGLSETKSISIPYSYLPAVGEDSVTQTGGEAHEGDILGMLTYQWKEDPDNPGVRTDQHETASETDGSYETRCTATRRYTLSVEYEPWPEDVASVSTVAGTKSALEIDLSRSMDSEGSRDAENDKLIADDAYRWRKVAEGTPLESTPEAPIQSTGTHTVKIVRGELALKVSAKKSFLKHWFETLKKNTLEVQVNVKREYTEDGGATPTEPEIKPLIVTIKEDDYKAAIETAGSDDDTVSFFTYYADGESTGVPSGNANHPYTDDDPQILPIGTYTLTLAENSLFKTLKYVDPETTDYKNHFTIGSSGDIDETDPTRQEDPTKDDDDETIGNPDSEKEGIENYIAEEIRDSENPASIGFYLGTDPDAHKPNGTYLDDRLGMVEVDLETGSLEVSKKVEGEAGETDKEFTFVVTLYNGEPEDGNIATDIDGTFGSMEFKEGVAEFTLKAGENETASFLPAGLTYTVVEKDNAAYTVNVVHKTEDEDSVSGLSEVDSIAVDSEDGTTEIIMETPETTETAETTGISEISEPTGTPETTETSGVAETTEITGNRELLDISKKAGEPIDTSLAEEHPKTVQGTIEAGKKEIEAFTNKRMPAKATLKVTKKLNMNGNTVPEGGYMFTFSLAPVVDSEGNSEDTQGDPVKEKLKEEGSAAITKTVTFATESTEEDDALTEEITNFFQDLQFKQPGVYKYVLKEVIEERKPGIIYDNTEYTVTVTVKEGEAESWGDLKAEVSVAKKGAEESEPDTSGEATFANRYATGNLTVSKTVEGDEGDKNKAFNFSVTLYKSDENKATEVSGSYDDSIDGMNFTEGIATFTLKHGEHKTAKGLPAGLSYTVEETEADKDGYGTFKEGNKGTIPVDGSATAEFINMKPVAEVTLQGSKKYEGGTLSDELFTFRLTAVDGAPMPEGTIGNSITTTNDTEGSFSFGRIMYHTSGTYQYTIEEVQGSEEENPTIIYDKTIYDVTVTVDDDDSDGKLDTSVVYQARDADTAEKAEFTNFTPLKTESVPNADEEVYPGQDITYEITWMNPNKTAAEVWVTDALDENVTFVSAKADGFGEDVVTYDPSSRTVTWNLGSQAGGAYGKVTLTVKVNESAVKTIENRAMVKVNEQSAVTNKVENPVENPDAVLPVDVTLHVEKSLTSAEGIDLPEKPYGFTFELRAADANPDADPLKKMLLGTSSGEDVDSTTGTKSVTVTVGPPTWTAEKELAELTYTEAGTYQYEVRENFGSDSEGTYAGITYDGTVYKVTVTVTETTDTTGARALAAKVMIDDGESEPIDSDLPATVKFTNTYNKEQVNVVLQGHKVLENGTLESGQFTFELRPVSAEVEEETTPALANIAMIGEELDDVVEPDGQMPQTDLAEQSEPTSQADGEMQSETTLQTDLIEQSEPTSQTDGEVQSELTPLTEAAEQGGLTSQTDGEVQSESTPQTEAVEQSEQVSQTEAVEQSEQTPLTEAAEQGDMTSPAGAEAQSDPPTETDASMMKRSASMKGGQSFLGTARLDGGSFLGTAPVSNGRSFSGAASVRRRSVVRSAPAMLSDDIIVEPVDESSLEPAAESAQEPIPEMDVNLDEMDVLEEESEIEQGSEAETTPEAEWTDPAAEDTGDIVPQITDDTVVDADLDVVIEEEEPVDLEQNDVLEEEIIDISDDESLEVSEGGVDAGTDDDFAGSEESSLENGTDTVEESETEEILELDQTIEMIGEPVKITSVPDMDEADGIDGLNEISEPTTKIISLAADRVPMPAGTKDGVAIAMNSGSGMFDFGSIVYDKPGEYHYTITEQVDNTVNNVEFDKTSYDVTVVVKWNESKELFVESVEYLPKDEAGTSGAPRSQAEFTNTWKEPETEPTETDPPQTEQTESNPPQTEQTETNPPQTDPPQTETNPPSVGSLTVTKVNRDATTNETIVLTDAQFYVALFADSTLTQRVGDVKTLSFPGNGSSASATFSNLPAGTYYVAETNTSGTPMSGGEYSGGVYSARYANGQQVTIAGNGSSAAFSFENVFSTLPDLQHYKNIKELIITKNVTDGAGAALQTNEVFYAGIFADAGYTQLAGHVSRNIVPFEMGGNSSASATVQVMVPSEGVTQLYVTEVDANGAPVTNSGSFPYKVSVVGGSLSLNINSGSQSVTITNTANEETEEETETETEITEEEFESEGAGSGGVGSGATAAKTGDETPIEKMLLLMAISLAMTLLIGSRSRRKKML